MPVLLPPEWLHAGTESMLPSGCGTRGARTVVCNADIVASVEYGSGSGSLAAWQHHHYTLAQYTVRYSAVTATPVTAAPLDVTAMLCGPPPVAHHGGTGGTTVVLMAISNSSGQARETQVLGIMPRHTGHASVYDTQPFRCSD